MNTTQKKATAKQIAVAELNLGNLTQIGNSEYVMEVDVEGEKHYVGIALTVKDTKGTKETENRPARPPFTLDSAVAAFEQEKEEAALKAAEKAAKSKKNDKPAE